MEYAALRPAAAALTAMSAPDWQSPAAKIPGLEVMNVLGSTATVPFLVSSTPRSVKQSARTRCPMAAIMEVQFSVNSEPSTGTGLRRPEASGSPSCILMHLRARPSPVRSAARGAVRYWISTPSARASSISKSLAGISALVLRYRMMALEPSRIAVRAASMAVFPPPTMNVLVPRSTAFPSATLPKTSIPAYIPWFFSPSIRMEEEPWAPAAMRRASKSFSSSLAFISLPMAVLYLTSTPSFSIAPNSSIRTESGSR